MCKQWLLITIALVPMIMFSGQGQSLDKQITPQPPTTAIEHNVKLQLFIDNQETISLFYNDAKGTSYRFIDPLEGTKISIYPRTGKAPASMIIERQEDGMYRINDDLFQLAIATGNKIFFSMSYCSYSNNKTLHRALNTPVFLILQSRLKVSMPQVF